MYAYPHLRPSSAKILYVIISSSYSHPLSVSAPSVSAGPVGFLGEDELVCTMASGGEEDLDVTALMETQGLTCRPTSIINFNTNCCSVTALASGSQPICFIRSTAEDGAVEDYHMPTALASTSGVTEVVAMAEVSMINFALHL